jgi:hypothetical protein
MKTSTLVLLGIGIYFLMRKPGTYYYTNPAADTSPLNGPPTAPYLPGWDPNRSYLPDVYGANTDPLLVYAAYGRTSVAGA